MFLFVCLFVCFFLIIKEVKNHCPHFCQYFRGFTFSSIFQFSFIYHKQVFILNVQINYKSQVYYNQIHVKVIVGLR